VSAGVPRLSVDTAEARMREGVVVQWTCTSSGGNPPPSLAFYRDRSPINDTAAAAAAVTPPDAKFGDTRASLTWTLSAADDLANFSCSASTDAIPGSLVYSPALRYRVQCQCLHYYYHLTASFPGQPG